MSTRSRNAFSAAVRPRRGDGAAPRSDGRAFSLVSMRGFASFPSATQNALKLALIRVSLDSVSGGWLLTTVSP